MGFKAIGKVVVAAAGTPVQAYASSPSVATSPLIYARQITIQFPALRSGGAANTNYLYVGDKSLVASTFVGVAAQLAVGQSITIPTYGAAVNLEDIWLDATDSGAECLVSVVG